MDDMEKKMLRHLLDPARYPMPKRRGRPLNGRNAATTKTSSKAIPDAWHGIDKEICLEAFREALEIADRNPDIAQMAAGKVKKRQADYDRTGPQVKGGAGQSPKRRQGRTHEIRVRRLCKRFLEIFTEHALFLSSQANSEAEAKAEDWLKILDGLPKGDRPN